MPANYTNKKVWRLLVDEPQDGAWNMAVDEAILHQRVKGDSLSTLRIYSWQRRTISLGYFQRIDQALADLCGQNNIELIRRPTGGGFVLHDQEFTFSVIFSRQDLRDRHQAVEYFRVIATCIQKALLALGVQVNLTESVFAGKDNHFFCFNNPTKYDLLINGKKVCGSAQRRYRDIILQQGSLILRTAGEPVFWQQAAGLEEVLQQKISLAEISTVFQQSFASELQLNFVPGNLSAAELLLARRLAAGKYTQASWNYQGYSQGDHA
ncbi:MAG: biotin/lipoate A/B protein ligase family protein [bacterium]|nr:biotin/lipoate A/B protein ligase family protein [bacterium]MDD5353937.1 biotin/lipoate A/B protein ligase family protein [bacterium]MDD5756030.1 biotin/lipoate A/B protein ligase family protein [bacterium]